LDAAAELLSNRPSTEVVGCAHTGLEAIALVEKTAPDLVLMDVAMPEMNGLEATRRIKSQPRAPLVVVVTLYDNTEYRARAEAVGADAFVSKGEFATQLVPLIDSLVASKGTRL
jgi:DNA-binding NarL/FixJ family response regulator